MELHEVKKRKLLTTVEAAAFMELSYMKLYRLVRRGKIEAINIAASGARPVYAFTPEAIQAYYDHLQDPDLGAEGQHK